MSRDSARTVFFATSAADPTAGPFPLPPVDERGSARRADGDAVLSLRQAAVRFGVPAGRLFVSWLKAWDDSCPAFVRAAHRERVTQVRQTGPFIVETVATVYSYRVARLPRREELQPRFRVRDGKARPEWPPSSHPRDNRLTAAEAAAATGEDIVTLWGTWETSFGPTGPEC